MTNTQHNNTQTHTHTHTRARARKGIWGICTAFKFSQIPVRCLASSCCKGKHREKQQENKSETKPVAEPVANDREERGQLHSEKALRGQNSAGREPTPEPKESELVGETAELIPLKA